MNNLLNKKILLIICGGISAYKSLELTRSFKKKGAQIKFNKILILKIKKALINKSLF